MIEIFQTAEKIQQICQKAGFKFCFIGGVALQRWGEPRFTKDVDLTLYTGFGNEEPFIEAFLGHFSFREPGTFEFALQNRVMLLKTASNIGIDISLGGLPFEEKMIERASYAQYPPSHNLFTCSAEDLVIMKSFASRGQDWVDVENVIVRQGNKLDWNYIMTQLAELVAVKESPEILERLNKLRTERETNP